MKLIEKLVKFGKLQQVFRGENSKGDRKTFKSKEQTQSWMEPDSKENEEDKKEKGKYAMKPDGKPINLNSKTEVLLHAPKHLENAKKDIDELLNKDPLTKEDKEKAKSIAKQIIADLEITKPIYLQDGKEGQTKIYIGDKQKKAYASKSPY